AVDHVLPSADIGGCLAQLVAESIVEEAPAMSDNPIGLTGDDLAVPSEPPTAFTCPECGGALWELAEGDVLVYRCHVGHAYSQEAINGAQADRVEVALWSALRALKENAALNRRTTARLHQHELGAPPPHPHP